MSALLVSSFAPAPGTGRGMRTYGILRALALLGPVDLLYARFGTAALPPVERVTLHEVVPGHGARRAAAALRALAAGVPRPVARGVVPELRDAAARFGHDRVIADDPMAAVALRGLDRPVIYSAHNLESAFRTDWGPRVAAFERDLLERSAETWMPSPADVAGARALAPAATVRLVPNVVDVAAIRPVPAAGRRALFVADFTYAPNREGLDFLLRDVMPHAGDLRIDVAGRGLDPPPPAGDRVTFHGFVPDLRPLYEGAGCALVPLLRGGGSPLKFVEALAHALPVVATPVAAAGLEAVAGTHYLEGADGPAFAAAITAALDDGAAVGAAGRALAEREYSIEALAARLA